MQPWFEKVTVPDGQSWTLFDRRLPAFPFNWHYHPEFELTLTLNSVGERFIGDHVAHYGDGDLILVGPNLPHAWQSRTTLCADQPHRALVVWFSESWAHGLTRHYAELAMLDTLLARAARGLSFSDAIRDAVRFRLLALVDAAPPSRWLGLVDILLMLAGDAGSQPLSLRGFVPQENAHDRARLERVLTHLHEHYAQPVRLSVLASLAAMSESQLQRFFKRCTRMTVSDYLAQLRIGHACALLLDRNRPIALIAEQAGYSQPSYFARQFRAVKGMTPMEFRRRFAAGAQMALSS
ncbi:AraC family transcriptional regulator (plasmid) [Paraburkholderia sp. PGU19]|uniref:helix-turn-helix domain-containing protein n=1 Tax=Paraburkholderia sp. PGU19 TaxID=2735434 RepID=UPI0015DAE916|nr:AraC family transcriptional regulator [Paraburkholderia sp. PGU19]BCG04285.1 AraC family transcriptional regulator [Paraburkholderia sp. PGU19]